MRAAQSEMAALKTPLQRTLFGTFRWALSLLFGCLRLGCLAPVSGRVCQRLNWMACRRYLNLSVSCKSEDRQWQTTSTANDKSKQTMTASDDVDPMAAYVTQAWSLQGQLPLLIAIAALLGLGKGGVPGFATVATAATVATSPTNIVGGLGFAVALQVPILTMIDISAAWLHYKDLDFETIKLLLPMSFCGMAFGTFLDRHLSDQNARLLVGILLLLIMGVQLGKDYIMELVTKKKRPRHTNNNLDEELSSLPSRESDLESAHDGAVESQTLTGDRNYPLRRRNRSTSSDSNDDILATETHCYSKKQSSSSSSQKIDRRTNLIWATVVGIVGGAATMLTNAMGPILNVYLLSVVQLSPTAYIGTRAMFFCFLNCGKLPMRFLNGTLGWSMIPFAAFLGSVSVLGVMGAKPIMLSMSESKFVKLELAVVAFSGLRLCWMGLFG